MSDQPGDCFAIPTSRPDKSGLAMTGYPAPFLAFELALGCRNKRKILRFAQNDSEGFFDYAQNDSEGFFDYAQNDSEGFFDYAQNDSERFFDYAQNDSEGFFDYAQSL
ncbi:MAG: hypothetical protein HY673_16450 [Chloroflexi bacterium]|nr:hypothetical protein [Chloroflexota bacterium]